MDDYDVFLNHRGPDVKGGFIAHLDEALRFAGLNPFLDKNSLVKGDPAFRSIDVALDVAKVHVAVVSRGYAESKYCLSELVAMMRSGKRVIPVFYDVEAAHLRRVESGPFAAAFKKHRRRERAEQVAEWADALRRLADITGFCFRLSDYKGDEAELKREVVGAVVSFMPTHEALQVERYVVGLEEHVNTCVHELEKLGGATSILGLVGMGGIGKTSLAKLIYNRLVDKKKYHFMSFLEIDRSSFTNLEVGSSLLSRLQKQLLWDLLRVPMNTPQSYEYWFDKLSSRGPVLIVLDDIQDKSQFDKLILDISLITPGSLIIVTSRDRHLLNVVLAESKFYRVHEVSLLGCDDSKKLFNWHAFRNKEAPNKFKGLAEGVSNACGGLPLALKVVGSSLFDKRCDEDGECIWREAIDALRKNPDVMNALKWSYNHLLEPEKLIFVDIACVFYGWERESALKIWESCRNCSSCCGCRTPNTSLRRLVDKSLVVLEGSRGVLAMHGLVRDMGQDIGRMEGSHLWEASTTKIASNRNEAANKVRALNLTNNVELNFGAENFARMPNLHFLVLDGCNVRGNFGDISNELRWLRWRYMPLTHLPTKLDLSNLISLDFSYSTMLANSWAESNPSLQACPNLLTLDLVGCTSITVLPDSIGHLSRLEKLNLSWCKNLQKLPSSIGQLTALHELDLPGCRSLEELPDTITALSGLRCLFLHGCSSISNLPTIMGHLINLDGLLIDLATEWQAAAIGQLNTLKHLVVTECTDEVITFLDTSGTLQNLDQLFGLQFWACSSITKLPEAIGLLTNLKILELRHCEKLQDLPNSIGLLKVLTRLQLQNCSSLETLPDSVGELTSLKVLIIEGCTSITKLPDSIRHLNVLEFLRVSGCGSLEGLGVSTALQGLCIWGCTSIDTELPGSSLIVMDIHCDWLFDAEHLELRNFRESRLVEANDCGSLCVVQDSRSGEFILRRDHKSSCCKVGMSMGDGTPALSPVSVGSSGCGRSAFQQPPDASQEFLWCAENCLATDDMRPTVLPGTVLNCIYGVVCLCCSSND